MTHLEKPSSFDDAPASSPEVAAVSVVRFEHRDSGLGIGTARPRLSWQVTTGDPAWSQTAYELELIGATRVRVESAEQVLVPWPFEPLSARRHVSVRVRVRSGETWTAWSDPTQVEAGLLGPEDWAARFITPRQQGGRRETATMLSRTVQVRGTVESARLYITALGAYVATINGQRVGDEVLAPGWTSYPYRLQYQTHDITHLLRDGDNDIAVIIGNGRYRGRLFDSRVRYGDRLALLAQVEVTYSDGSVETIGTDEQWIAQASQIISNDLYDGQLTDLRRPSTEAGTVEYLDEDLGKLVAPCGPPLRVTEVLPARRIWTSPTGKLLIDFGQNLAGWVRLRVRDTTAGQQIVVRHAEVLEDGDLCLRALRTAKATDTYILDGSTDVLLEPTFTFHGFRYAEVTGVPNLRTRDVEAVVVGANLRRTGWFHCSDPDLEQLHENIVWSIRGNFLDVPTDCPSRDERLGWTGDLQLIYPTAAFLFDTAGYITSWLADLAVDQSSDGTVQPFVPYLPLDDELRRMHETHPRTPAGWGDAAVVVPWVLYRRYGDVQLLQRQYPSMCAWVDKIASSTLAGVITTGFQFGDWCDPAAPAQDPSAAAADPYVIATAYLARSADIVAEAARVLGRESEAESYTALANRTRESFNREYVTAAGRITNDVPTVYALALHWNLLADQQKHGAASRLADLVRSNTFRAATGFLGTAAIADALCSGGYPDLAYRLLLERDCPSWLYAVRQGATTLWERWDSLLPDGRPHPGGMNSFNNYWLGAIGDWMHRTIAGITATAPGYREFLVHPIPHSGISHASADHDTPYGRAGVAWWRGQGQFTLTVTVPPGARAAVQLPGSTSTLTVPHGRHKWTVPDPCSIEAARAVSTVRELIDSQEQWGQVIDLLAKFGIDIGNARRFKSPGRFLDFPAGSLPIHVAYEDGLSIRAKQAVDDLLNREVGVSTQAQAPDRS